MPTATFAYLDLAEGAIPPAIRRHAERNLPRYTSYPTALAFHEGVGEADARVIDRHAAGALLRFDRAGAFGASAL